MRYTYLYLCGKIPYGNSGKTAFLFFAFITSRAKVVGVRMNNICSAPQQNRHTYWFFCSYAYRRKGGERTNPSPATIHAARLESQKIRNAKTAFFFFAFITSRAKVVGVRMNNICSAPQQNLAYVLNFLLQLLKFLFTITHAEIVGDVYKKTWNNSVFTYWQIKNFMIDLLLIFNGSGFDAKNAYYLLLNVI